MKITDWKLLNRNFNIFPPKSYSENSYYYKTLYNNKKLFIQTPKNILYTLPKQNTKFGMYITLGFNDYSTNKNTKQFIDTLINIDRFIKKQSKILIKLTNKEYNVPNYKNSVYFNNTKTIAFITVTIPLISNIPSISIYDHNKKPKNLDYMKPFSEAIHILSLSYVWFSNNKLGLQWNIIQSKIFQPIFLPNECMIQDDFENDISNVESDNSNQQKPILDKESDPIYGSFIKMKRLGVPEPVIRIQLTAKNLSYNDFITFDTTGIINNISSNIKPNSNNLLKEISGNHNLKKTKINKRKKHRSRQNNFAPTSDQLKKVLLSLKKVHK